MNETQRNIEAYKAALPGLKERVLAVALLLVMSAVMMTSATFAWITLSRAPEVAEVSTNITTNGNLEIALVQPDGSAPAESAIGDSSAAQGQNIISANITWGNLVNLSDESYGLNNIVLRPALLGNINDLINQPLKGVDYSADGRMDQYYNEDYQFANWTIKEDGSGYFKFNTIPQFGVRAISSIEYTYVNNSYFGYTQIRNRATGIQGNVITGYETVTKNSKYINSLAGLIGDFMTDQLNDSDTDVSAYIGDLYHMLTDVYNLMTGSNGQANCFEDALAELANAQVYLKYGGKAEYKDHIYTKETLMSASAADLTANGVSLPSLTKYKTLKNNVNTLLYGTDGELGAEDETPDCLYDYYRQIYPRTVEGTDQVDETYDSGKAVMRSAVMTYIDKMVNIASTEITCEGETNTVAQLTASKSKATSLLGKQVDGKITNGYLKDFEQIVGGRLNAEGVKVSAKYIITVSITAKTIRTSAVEPYEFDKDVASTDTAAAADKGDYTGVAKDTYGMAMDYWVRTNATDSYLMLEGNVLTESETVRATGLDKNGNEVEYSTVTVTQVTTDENGQQQTLSNDVTIYIVAENGKDVYYRANNHTVLYTEGEQLAEGQTLSEPKALMKEVTKIIGYEGENRIWNAEDDIFMSIDSTTQGSGSCYVFYAEDPTQQKNGMRLLANLRVAFIDNNEGSATKGKLVALAKLDTDNSYEENGKVTMPLVLMDDGSSNLTKMEDGNLAVMRLEQNTPTKLLTLVYLDGREVSNADVLAASEIHGQLNIQFGSSVDLSPIEDEDLAAATRTISAAIKKSTDSQYGSNANAITFNYDTETSPMTVDVKVMVQGDNPANASAFFMRKVNATQGSRETSFILQRSQTEEGVYYGSYTFTSPGNYILRTVTLDGMDYSLPADEDPTTDAEYPRVEISGFGIDNITLKYDGVTVTEREKTIMVGGKKVSADLSLKFATDQAKLPGVVRLQFAEEKTGTRATAIMAYNPNDTTWYGTANFSASGRYKLQYIILDGEYTELDPKYQQVLDISMGLTVRVTDAPGSQRDKLWDGNSYWVNMYVEIFNEAGEEIPYLTGAKLNYGVGSSIIDSMNPDVVWDASKGYYTGNILVSGPGIYNFISVDVGGNVLKNTVGTTPQYNCTSPNPPAYYDAEPMKGMDYFLDKGLDNLYAGVRLEEAQAAMVTAVFYNAEDGQEYKSAQVRQYGTATMIDGKPISEFRFTIPKTNKTPGQTGDWTIKRLELVNVFANGEMHLAENPLIMNLTHNAETNDLHVQVVSVKMDIQAAGDTEFTGVLLESKDTGAVTISITDHKGSKLDVPVSDIELQYQLKLNSWKDKGGYDATHLADQSGAGETDTYTIKSSDGKSYKLDAVKLTYAGVYEPHKMTITIGDETTEYQTAQLKDMGMPVFTLTTTKPVISLDSTTPAHGETYNTIWTDGNSKSVKTTVDGRTITIYPDATVTTGCNASVTINRQAKVALKLTGLGKATKATLAFTSASGTVYMYPTTESGDKGDNQTNSFEWNGSSEVVTRIIGNYKNAGCSEMSGLTNAGQLTSNSYITFEMNNGSTTISVTVAIDPYKIIQE